MINAGYRFTYFTVIGAILGIAIIKGAKNVKFNVLGKIAIGWVATPLLAGIIALVSLFIVQNVFDQEVYSDQPPAVETEQAVIFRDAGSISE